MKTIAVLALAAGLLAAAPPQQFKLNFDHLAAKASDSVDISLPAPMLRLAAKFLDSDDADEAKVKKLVANIDGVYIRHFEFKADNVWTQSDIEGIRGQLRSPEWARIVGVNSDSGSGNTEIYLRIVDGKTSGVAIIATESREFTVINIAGNIDLDDLAALGGHFDIPKIKIPKDKK